MKKRTMPLLAAIVVAMLVLLPAQTFASQANPYIPVDQDEAPLEAPAEAEPESAATVISSMTLDNVDTSLVDGVIPTYNATIASTTPSVPGVYIIEEYWSTNANFDWITGPDHAMGRPASGTPVAGDTYTYGIVMGVPNGDVAFEQGSTIIIKGKTYNVVRVFASGMSNDGGYFYFNTLYLDGPKVTATEVRMVPLYRMYNTKTSEHLWTRNKAEYDSCGSGNYRDWKAEGVAWKVPSKSNKPVYRLYNLKSGDHHYTTSAAERDKLVGSGQWRNEGVAFYSAAKGDVGAIPIYRVYNGRLKRGQHHYTKSAAERDSLVKNSGWRDEGVGFYGYK